MRKSAIGLLSLAVAGVSGLLLAASEFRHYSVLEWFGVSFTNVVAGTKLASTTGVIDSSGQWSIPSGATDSSVVDENGVRYLNINSPVLTASGPWFNTATPAFAGAADAYRIDCSTMFPITDNLPKLPSGVKSAMALSGRDGGLSFYGYGANGWVRISDTEVEANPSVCYDQRAEFRRINGALYVTYSIKVGGDYIELKDDAGNILIPAAEQGLVRMVEFRGISNVRSLFGSHLKSTVSATQIAPPGYPMMLLDWYSVVLQGVDLGTVLDLTTGVLNESGQWTLPYEGFTADVREFEGERYLCVEQQGTTLTGPEFTATRASATDRSEVEFSMRFSRGDSVLNELVEGTKAAITIATDSEGGVSFYGYSGEGTENGWTKLAAEGVEAQYSYWYALMAAFENDESGVLYVSYYVKTYTGYRALVDEKGKSRFVAGGGGRAPVQFAQVLGDTDIRFMTGTDMMFDPGFAYYWVGGPSGYWADGENWSHELGGTPCGQYPTATDAAVITSKTTIQIEGADANVSNLIVNAALTLEGPREMGLAIYGGTFGSGRIILSGSSLKAGVADELSLSASIEIAEATENRIVSYNDGTSAYQLKFTGRLTGSGTVIFTENTNAVSQANGGGIRLMGDTSDFTGTARFVYVNPRAKTGFEAEASCGNVGSRWSFFEAGVVPTAGTSAGDTGLPQFPFKVSNRLYEFGQCSGTIPSFRTAESAMLVSNIVIEVGGLNENSSLDGDWVNAEAGRTVRWVAGEGSVFSYDVWNTTLFEVAGGGAVRFLSENALPERLAFVSKGGFVNIDAEIDVSPVLQGSAAAIGVDDGGVDCLWKASLDASNTGGLVKRGAGALRLAQIPRYSGVTHIEEGTLIVPFGTALGQLEIADGAHIQIDLTGVSEHDRLIFAAGSSEGGLRGDDKIEFINVPEDYVLPDPLWTDEGGVIYSTDTHIYIWTGAADDGGLWSNLNNWQVDYAAPTKLPSDYDIVRVPAAVKQHVTVDVAANIWGIQCEEGALPFRFTSPDMTNGTYKTDNTSVLSVGSGALTGFFGVGGFITTSPIVLSAAESNTTSFIGPLSAPSFTKKGLGDVVIGGQNAFNSIVIEEGALRIARPEDIRDFRMDFDATDELAFHYDGSNNLDEWKSRDRVFSFKYSDGEYAKVTTDYFGGARAVMLRPTEYGSFARYALSTADTNQVGSSKSLFILYHATQVENFAFLYGEAKDELMGLRIGQDDKHRWYRASDNQTDGAFTGIAPSSELIVDGEDYLTSWFASDFEPIENGGVEYLGTSRQSKGFKGAIAEIVAYLRPLSHAEQAAVALSLMGKWNLGGSYEALSHTAFVTMRPGTTLDLGHTSQTVANFTGSGVVTNGVLVTLDRQVTELDGPLTIPAVDGTTYNIMKRKTELVITGGEGKQATIIIPQGCTSGRVFFEGRVTWKNTDPGIEIQGPDAGWYTIVNTGGGSCIIIR